MGWLNTALDIANAGMNASQLTKLRDLEKGAEQQALLNFILSHFREQLFKTNQLLRSLAGVVDSNPMAVLVTAQAVRHQGMLDLVTPDKFSELTDKEYCAATHRLLAESIAVAQTRLSPEQRQQAPAVLELTDNVLALNGLIRLEQMRVELQAAGLSDFELKTRPRTWGCLALITLGLLYPVVAAFAVMSGDTAGILAGVVGLALAGLLFVKMFNARGAADTLERLKQKYGENAEFDRTEYTKLRQRFGENSLQGYEAMRADWVRTIEPIFAGTGIPFRDLLNLPDTPAGSAAPIAPSRPRAEAAVSPQLSSRAAASTTAGFCAQCGKPLVANAKFCMHCGQPTLPRQG